MAKCKLFCTTQMQCVVSAILIILYGQKQSEIQDYLFATNANNILIGPTYFTVRHLREFTRSVNLSRGSRIVLRRVRFLAQKNPMRCTYPFDSAQRLDLFVQCVRLSRLSVGFRTQKHRSFIHLKLNSSKPVSTAPASLFMSP